MKTKRVLHAIFTMFFLFIILHSCQRANTNLDEEQSNTLSITEKSFNPAFDWKTTHNIAIEINSTEKSIVNITSIDNKIRYHRGTHQGGGNTYSVNLCIPTYIKQLNLNNYAFSVSSNTITLNLAN